MKNVELSLAMDLNLRTAALLSGAITADGIDLKNNTEMWGPRLFRHQMQTREFDICDMSLTTVFMMIDRGDTSFVPVPVFTMRHFFHTTALISERSGVESPADLRGKRIGIPGYQSAASLWCRGAFEHEFGVTPVEVEWFTQQSADESAGEIAFVPPKGLRITTISPTQAIAQLLLDGEIDAYFNVLRPTPELLAEGSGVRRLFPDPRAEGIRYFLKTGLYPTNHCIVVKREVVDQYPWVPFNIFKAFVASSERALVPAEAIDPYIETGLLEPGTRDALAQNLYGHGIDSDALVIETFGQYCHEQGYTSRALAPNEVFSHAQWI
ncbi:MAG TPA: hypothetical protein VMU99_11170 [Acidimicrobiales bacterium]|nr:hypothetical protein [Acidimicrobiales bacterium]